MCNSDKLGEEVLQTDILNIYQIEFVEIISLFLKRLFVVISNKIHIFQIITKTKIYSSIHFIFHNK